MKGCMEKGPKMTPDLMSNSPLIYKHRQGKLEGEFSSSSEVTWGFIPGTPSHMNMHRSLYQNTLKS